MAEHLTIGVIGEGNINSVLEEGPTELIFSVISAERSTETKELRVPKTKLVVGKKGITVLNETLITYDKILSVGYEDDQD